MTDPKAGTSDPKKARLTHVFGSAPWLKALEKKRYRAKVFKSGNSLAIRIPAGTKLTPGMEMDLLVEDGQFLSLEPIEQPKRKFNIAKVAGSARNLQFIKDEDRVFEERPLLWEELDRNDGEKA